MQDPTFAIVRIGQIHEIVRFFASNSERVVRWRCRWISLLTFAAITSNGTDKETHL